MRSSSHTLPPRRARSASERCSSASGRRGSRPRARTFVEVCPLCQEIAAEQGWLKEGSPTTPTFEDEPRRKRFSLASFLDPRRAVPEETLAPEPILRRLSDHERAMVEAADLFNASPYRRTVGGIGKSLGKPHVSVVPLSGVNRRSSSPSPGTSRGTSTASSRTRRSPSGSPSGATRSRSSSRRSGCGTRASTRTAGSCPRSRASSAAPAPPYNQRTMIYCVIPRELEDELFDKMVEYYKDNPNVTVIVDRREGPDRRRAPARDGRQARDSRPAPAARPRDVPRDRRRARSRRLESPAWRSWARRPSRTTSAASGSTPPPARPSRARAPRTATRSAPSRARPRRTSTAQSPPRRRPTRTGASCPRRGAARSSSASRSS